MFEKQIDTVKKIAAYTSQFDFVKAIAISGSIRNGFGTEKSDVDTYIYLTRDITQAERDNLINVKVQHKEAIDYWGPGDYFIVEESGIEVDFIYFRTDFMEHQLQRVLDAYQANIGYSTAFWHTIKQSLVIHDSDDWFANLQTKANQPYPDELVEAIIKQNFPILADITVSYRQQIAKAIIRQDLLSINHRITAFLASYFDILFAINKLTHPGEKRIMQFALQCKKQPQNMQNEINNLLKHACNPDEVILDNVDKLVTHLRSLMIAENLLKA